MRWVIKIYIIIIRYSAEKLLSHSQTVLVSSVFAQRQYTTHTQILLFEVDSALAAPWAHDGLLLHILPTA